jgi:hypothetical protein
MDTGYPMSFSLTNPMTAVTTHASVLEFVAVEGWCHVPTWVCTHARKPKHVTADHASSRLYRRRQSRHCCVGKQNNKSTTLWWLDSVPI